MFCVKLSKTSFYVFHLFIFEEHTCSEIHLQLEAKPALKPVFVVQVVLRVLSADTTAAQLI